MYLPRASFPESEGRSGLPASRQPRKSETPTPCLACRSGASAETARQEIENSREKGENGNVVSNVAIVLLLFHLVP